MPQTTSVQFRTRTPAESAAGMNSASLWIRRATNWPEFNIVINSGEPNWFERLVGAIATYRGESEGKVAERITRVIARSEAIRYVQLGHPENILIDDGSIRAKIVPEHLLHYGHVGAEPDEALA